MAIPDYTKTNWVNGTTPINETNLNKIENQLDLVTDGINSINNAKITATTSGMNLLLSDSVYDTAMVKNDTKNVFDKKQIRNPVISSNGYGIQLTLKPNTAYTMSSNVPQSAQNSADVFFAAGESLSGLTTATNGIWEGQTRTFTSDANGYMIVAFRRQAGDEAMNLKDYWYQVEEGSSATSYEPYDATIKAISKNLFNIDEAVLQEGIFDGATGEYISLSAGVYITENYTEVEENKTYDITSYEDIEVTHPRIVFYDEDKNVIDVKTTPLAFKTPNGTKYIRFQITSYNVALYVVEHIDRYTLSAGEEKEIFTYDEETHIYSDAPITIVYNTENRLLGNQDLLSINNNTDQKIEEYKEEAKPHLVNATPYENTDYPVNFISNTKNLFYAKNIGVSTNGVTSSWYGSKLSVNGTATANLRTPSKGVYIPLEAGDYAISVSLISGSIPTPVGTAFYLINKTNTQLARISVNGRAPVIFSLSEPQDVELYMYIDNGTAFSNAVFGIQIEKGSYPTTYEEYIEPKINVNEQKIYGQKIVSSRNMFNLTGTYTKSGVTYTFNGSTMNMNGTTTGEGGYASLNSLPIVTILTPGTYTLSFTHISGTPAPNIGSVVVRNMYNYTNLIDTTYETGRGYTFTVSYNVPIGITLYTWSGKTFTNYKVGIQLENGSTATPYQNYVDPSIVADGNTIYTQQPFNDQFRLVKVIGSTGSGSNITFSDDNIGNKAYMIFVSKIAQDGTYCDVLFVRLGARAITKLGGVGSTTPTVSLSGNEMTIGGLGTYSMVVIYQVMNRWY